jgi:DNA-binding NarL/FixJ family response regulator
MTNSDQKSISIVFVEDYQLIRSAVTSYVNTLDDIKILAEADNAEDGIRLVEEHKPDVVLMDLGLPKMNGIEATRFLKSQNPDVKVVILTSQETDDSVIAALGAGANAYCLKSIPTDKLIEVIRNVMDGAAWLDPKIASVALSVFSRVEPSKQESEASDISLGEREREVLRLLTLGKNNNEIAEELYVSVHTVKSQVSTLLQKLSVNDRVQAAVKAVTQGLVSLD